MFASTLQTTDVVLSTADNKATLVVQRLGPSPRRCISQFRLFAAQI